MNASYRFVSWGVIPVASYLSGQLAGAIGVQPTLLLASICLMSAALWLLQPRLLALRSIPPAIEEPAEHSLPVAAPGLAQP